MIPNYVQIDMVIVSINTGNHTISLNKHTIGLEIYNSTRQYTFRPMCTMHSDVWLNLMQDSEKSCGLDLSENGTRLNIKV